MPNGEFVKKSFKLWSLFVSLMMLGGCMELLPIDREQVSKIHSFSITPENGVILRDNSFKINLNATVGYEVRIYIHNIVTGSAQVYRVEKDGAYDQSIEVKYTALPVSGADGSLTSTSSGWTKTGVNIGVDYTIYAMVCDFANIPGNALCSTSNGYRITFRNSFF